MLKKPIAMHPFFFGLFPIFFLYSHNIEQLSFSEVIIPAALTIGFTAIALPVMWLILKKDINKAGMFVSLFLVLFFSYGHAYSLVEGFKISSVIIGRHRYLAIAWAILFIVAAFFIIRARKDLKGITAILNIIAVSLVVISLANIAVFKFRAEDASWGLEPSQKPQASYKETQTDMDIYYIILDGYASSRTLEEVYGYDNSSFEKYLEDKGFYIASKSASNYPSSFLSMASSLNMEYINYLGDKLGMSSNDRSLPYKMIEQNRIADFLKSHGYRFVHFSSGWGPTNHNRYADLNISVSQKKLNEFQSILIKTTALRVLEGNLLKDIARMRVINTFDQLSKIPQIEGNKFIFAHIVCPHPPYVFDREGGPVPETKFDMDIWGGDQKEYYLNQLIYLNQEIKGFIDSALETSGQSPLIILQADHGPRNTFIPGQYPTDDMFREGMRIFNAYYMPGQRYDLLYDSITPVNSFRVVFNTYFGTSYPLLEDKSYNSFEAAPYRFTEITDIVSYE